VLTPEAGVLKVTASVGVSFCDGPPGARQTRAALLEAADAALYEAKRGGRDRVALAPSIRYSGSQLPAAQGGEE
jgi:PleD family two-component response regulator